jgi:hypothetical protein
LNPRTELQHLETLLERIKELGRSLEAEVSQ